MSIKVSKKAEEMIKKQLKDKDRENALLRIFVKSFG